MTLRALPDLLRLARLLGACQVYLLSGCAGASLATYRCAAPGGPPEAGRLDPHRLNLDVPSGSALFLDVFPRRLS